LNCLRIKLADFGARKKMLSFGWTGEATAAGGECFRAAIL